jgi:capsular exopolysaccharide synthesis family protein
MPPKTAPPSQEITLVDLVAICWRRRVATGIAAIAVAIVVIVVGLRINPLYEATASISVDHSGGVPFQKEQNATKVDYTLLNTQRDLLLSNQVLDQAIKDSGLTESPAYKSSKDPVDMLRSRMHITTSRDSWVIAVALRDESAERAGKALGKVFESFLAQQSTLQTNRNQDAIAGLQTQLKMATEHLLKAQADDEKFRRDNGIVETDPDNNGVSIGLRRLYDQRGTIERDLEISKALSTKVEEAMRIEDPAQRLDALMRVDAISANRVIVDNQRDLDQLSVESVRLGQKYKAGHPRMKEITEQIKAKEAQLEYAVAISRAGIDSRNQQLTAQLDAINAAISAAQAEVTKYQNNLIKLQMMRQESTSLETIYGELMTRLRQEEVVGAIGGNKMVMVDPPVVSNYPVNVKTSLLLAAALFLGGIGGVLTALLLETIDSRIRGADATRALTDLPLLGDVPLVEGMAPLGRGGDPEAMHEIAEAYRGLRAALHLSRRKEGSQILMVVSSSPGEGKSTVATRLSISLSAAGSRVLLVDCDMRKPTLHNQVGEQVERGVSFLLAGDEGITPLPTSYANLDFLGVGVRPPNPGELLHSPMLKTFIANCRKSYDYVVFDTPPVGMVSDALLIGEQVDGIILVVRDRYTAKNLLALSLSRLSSLREKMLGVVLNGLKLEGNERGKYGYGTEPQKTPA